MPRANRYFLSGYVWHITHRCHKQEFLLKFARDRRRWRDWLFEGRKRFGLCVLNYIVTSNHVHLLVHDRGQGEIARSMQLIAGRTAQEYNRRKARKGAFWEDRYHATAVDTNQYLARCLTYIDMNMVRAGVVSHPAQWDTCGYREVVMPPQRYRIIDIATLSSLLGFSTLEQLQGARAEWIETALRTGRQSRQKQWTESIAVGRAAFVERVQRELGVDGRYRNVLPEGDDYCLREPVGPYQADSAEKMGVLSNRNEPYRVGIDD